MSKLNEFFAGPIGHLEKAGLYKGYALYTSNDLKDKFITSYENSVYNDYNSTKIRKLVDENILIPVFSTRSMIKFFIVRPILKYTSEVVFGFLDRENKKIYILIDSSADIFGMSLDEEISTTTIHEIIHYIASKNPRQFLSLFIKELCKYYIYVYGSIFYCKNLNEKDVIPIITKLLMRFETSDKGIVNHEFQNILTKYLFKKSDLNESDFSKVARSYEHTIFLYYSDNFKCFEYPWVYFHKIHQEGFKEVFGYNTYNKICYQEAINPSEVICSISHLPFIKTKIIKSFNMI